MTTSSRILWGMTLAMSGAGALMLAVFLGPRHDLPVMPRPATDKDVLRVAHVQPVWPDPHRWGFPLPTQNQFVLCLWEPLIECDPETGQPQPAAAEGWRWSDDRRALTIALRRDGRWSNGEPVTARDFVRAWRRLLLQDGGQAAVLFPVENAEKFHREKGADGGSLGLEVVDDFTLRIKLGAVRSTFVAELADPLLSPLHESTEKVLKEERYRREPATLVTNGAFCLERAKAGSFRLKTNVHYHGRSTVRLAGVEYICADNFRMARLLVAAGRADLMAPIPAGSPTAVPTRRCLTEESEMAMVITAMDLNVTRGPLRDPRVRRALALAMDRAGSIRKDDADRLVPAYAWVPDMPGRPRLSLLKENADEARRLLAEAGYPGGRNFPVLIMPMSARDANYGYWQAWTERWFRELGIRTYLAFQTEEERKRGMKTGDYDVYPSGLIATVPDAGDMLGVFAFPETFSGTRWINPEMKRLLAEANNTTGLERLQRLEQIERQAMEAVPTIPMMFERRRTLLSVEVEGWYADPLGRQALKRLALRPLENGEPARPNAL
ncbi:MAG TPA: ABC transporter substrate-binding protein [Lacunisphaera sp.]